MYIPYLTSSIALKMKLPTEGSCRFHGTYLKQKKQFYQSKLDKQKCTVSIILRVIVSNDTQEIQFTPNKKVGKFRHVFNSLMALI